MPNEYDIDFRAQPACYRYEPNEKGVFKVQPYKSDLLPLWRYKDEGAAKESATAIWERYESYRATEDFVGMDMARKYLQMGFTRAMRYAKYPGGKKYDAEGNKREEQTWADAEKRKAAVIFRDYWQQVLADPVYERLKQHHVAHVYDPGCGVMG